MKRRTHIVIAAVLSLCLCAGFAGCKGGEKDTVVIWCGETEKSLVETLAAEFKAANTDVAENIRVEVQDSWNAQSVVAKDPEAAADVFLIPHDQVGIMAKAGPVSYTHLKIRISVQDARGNDHLRAAGLAK